MKKPTDPRARFFRQFHGLKLTHRAHVIGDAACAILAVVTFRFVIWALFGPVCDIPGL